MITVYGMSASGNCHKLRLLLAQLGREYRWIEVDIIHGETRTPEYLAKNPNGKVPIIQLDDGRVLAESNAIVCYLADGSRYLPDDAWQRAQALSWMFFEQYSHEPFIAVARYIRLFTPADSPRRTELPRLIEGGHRALAVMQQHLQHQPWFTGEAYGVADIALFPYTAAAADGGFDLSGYAAVGDWLARVRAMPGYVEMPAVPVSSTQTRTD